MSKAFTYRVTSAGRKFQPIERRCAYPPCPEIVVQTKASQPNRYHCRRCASLHRHYQSPTTNIPTTPAI